MHHLRAELTREGVLRAADLRQARTASGRNRGLVIVRSGRDSQRHVFHHLEDEPAPATPPCVPTSFSSTAP